MVAEKVDVIDHFDADTERSQMGSISGSLLKERFDKTLVPLL